MDHVYVVIMAGGKGERFWPLSTDDVPKPFLKLIGDRSLIQMTLDRVAGIIPYERVFVVLGKEHYGIAREQLPELKERNFIIEHTGKDTAPCIGLSALSLFSIDDDPLMVVLPADHYCPDYKRFQETIIGCCRLVKEKDCLVTIGVKPSRPETGYGYIKVSNSEKVVDGVISFRVERFVEKPDLERAKRFLMEGDYYWNSGMFVWRAKTVLEGIKRHMPHLSDRLLELHKALSINDMEAAISIYSRVEGISIDYGLMEKANNVMMVEAKFVWDDIGTWSSIPRIIGKDEMGNCIKGEIFLIDTAGCIIYGDEVPVGTIGVSDLIIVATKRGALVCDKDRAQEVREIGKRFLKKDT
jgi:mannose-1-phosphate guanylyltransferase